MDNGSVFGPQPICCRCSKARFWAKKAFFVSKNGLNKTKYPCDAYPDESPTKCWDIFEWLKDEEYVKLCPHFVRGAPQAEKPTLASR
jgi:hypothetical protein